MSNKELLKSVKDIRKQLIQFKKISNTDKENAVKIANKVIKECDFIIIDKNTNNKVYNEMCKLRDMMNLYIKNIKALNDIKNKWRVNKK